MVAFLVVVFSSVVSFIMYIIWVVNQLLSKHHPCQHQTRWTVRKRNLRLKLHKFPDKSRPPLDQPRQIWQDESAEPVTVDRKDTTHIAFQWAHEADGYMYTRTLHLIQSLGSGASTSGPHRSPVWCISARAIHYRSFRQCGMDHIMPWI